MSKERAVTRSISYVERREHMRRLKHHDEKGQQCSKPPTKARYMDVKEGTISIPVPSFSAYSPRFTLGNVECSVKVDSPLLPQIELKETFTLISAFLNDSVFSGKFYFVPLPFVALSPLAKTNPIPICKVDSDVPSSLNYTNPTVPEMELHRAKILKSKPNFEFWVTRSQLSMPKLELDEIANPDVEIKIESENSFKHTSLIPQMRLPLIEFGVLSVDLNSEMPSVNFSISVPLLDINPLSPQHTDRVVSVATEIESCELQAPIVPSIDLSSPEDTARKADNVVIDTELMISPKTEPKMAEISTKDWRGPVSRKIKQNSSVGSVETETASTLEAGSGEGSSELKDPLEVLFGEGAGKVRDVEPLLILFKDVPNDSYIQTFEMFLLRSYREKHGGYPEVKKLSLRDDWNKREIEQWLDEGKLFLIDLDTEDVKINKELLADRLWAIFSKRRGVVVFYTKDDKIFERYKALLNEINWNKLQLGAKIVKITPRKLSFEEKLKLAGLVFGFVDIGEVPASMDAILNASRDKYEAKLKKLEEEYYHILGIVKPGENESVEHLRGKAFIAHWLIKQLEEKEGEKKDWKFIKDHVKTEEPKNGVIVDVCFNDENYEFETLFEEGFGKIHKTLRKYEQFQANVEIVVEPITAFLHAKEFAKLIRLVKQVYPTLNVGFYTLDLKNERLMPLEDYLKELKDFSSSKARKPNKMVKA